MEEEKEGKNVRREKKKGERRKEGEGRKVYEKGEKKIGMKIGK